MRVDLGEKPPSLNDVYRRHICGILLRPSEPDKTIVRNYAPTFHSARMHIFIPQVNSRRIAIISLSLCMIELKSIKASRLNQAK